MFHLPSPSFLSFFIQCFQQETHRAEAINTITCIDLIPKSITSGTKNQAIEAITVCPLDVAICIQPVNLL